MRLCALITYLNNWNQINRCHKVARVTVVEHNDLLAPCCSQPSSSNLKPELGDVVDNCTATAYGTTSDHLFVIRKDLQMNMNHSRVITGTGVVERRDDFFGGKGIR